LKLGAGGVQLQLESVRALLLGGIAFDTPTEGRGTPISGNDHTFPLYVSQEEADHAGFRRQFHFLANFSGSAAGLAPGAAVTLHGLPIGEVTSVGLRYDKTADRVVVAVKFDVELDRIANFPEAATIPQPVLLGELVRRGLRATLASSSLLTGQQEVALDIQPNAPPAELGVDGDVFVLPVTSSAGFGDLAQTAGALLAKLDALPFDQIGKNLNDTLRGASTITNDPQIPQAIASLQTTLASVQDLVREAGTGIDPLMKELPQLSVGLQDAVTRINTLLSSVNTGYGGDSKFARDTDRLMLQLGDAARSLRVLADLLTRHPEALIRGRTNTGPE
jgi:paraquat-inducible protein B